MNNPNLTVIKAGFSKYLFRYNDIGFSRETLTYYLTNINGTIYFHADDGIHGDELWKIDSSGNVVLLDVVPGVSPSAPSELTNVNGTLYFAANDSTHGYELWKIDSSGSPVLVQDINPGVSPSSPSLLTNVNGTLYFAANDGTHGYELWKINSSGSPVLVKDIYPGTNWSFPNHLTNVNGTLYFTANDDIRYGAGLWKVDSSGNAVLVKDVDLDTGWSGPTNLTNVNGTLYFDAFDDTHGYALWKIDSSGNPVLVKDFNPEILPPGEDVVGTSELTYVNGTLYFSANDGVHGYELWKIDSSGNAVLVQDINPGNRLSYTNSSYPYELTNVNGTLYFAADDGIHGGELWKIDSSGSPVLVKDFYSGIYDPFANRFGSHLYYLTNINDTIYFGANDGVHNDQVWMSDGTTAGTQVIDIFPGNDTFSSNPTDLFTVNNKLFFFAFDSTSQSRALWQLRTPTKNSTRNDFNGDGRSDILWRSDIGGVALWQMDGATVSATNLTSTPQLDPSWKTAGTGDFNGDSKSDILWRNDSGAVAVWTMNGSTVVSSNLTSTPSLDHSWTVAGTGDYNGDGKSDILWRNDSGAIAVWTMDGTTVKSSSLTSTSLTPTPNIDPRNSILALDNSWKVAGNSDFNGDGQSDILWRNDDGSVALWQMDGSTVLSSSLTSTPTLDGSWKINGTGDFNGDGKADILWRNSNTGAVDIWQMNGSTVTLSSLTSTPSLDSSWTVAGIGDYNSDGKADILWRKDSGAVDIWTMNGATVISSNLTSIQPDSNSWKIAAPII
jgi:ELWxxDGT repeat protein